MTCFQQEVRGLGAVARMIIRRLDAKRDFKFNGRTLTVRAAALNEGWRIRVFEADRPVTAIVYTVAHETTLDASKTSIPADLVDELMTLAQSDVEKGLVKLIA